MSLTRKKTNLFDELLIAAKWRLLLSCFLIAPTAGSTITATDTNDVTMLATPTEMAEGFTPRQELVCSFLHGGNSDFSDVMSLLLSKTSEYGSDVFQEIAALSSASPNAVSVKNSLGAAVTGSLDTHGNSSIRYQWAYPGNDVQGSYRCQAFGMDKFGHPRVSTAEVEITEKRVDAASILTLVKTLTLTQQTQAAEIVSLQQRVNQSQAAAFEANREFQGHQYFLSRPKMHDVAVSQALCWAFGGDLLEIDSAAEFDFIKGFLDQQNADIRVDIGLSDIKRKGTYTLMSSQQTMNYSNWRHGEPSNGDERCVGLFDDDGRQMYDTPCAENWLTRCICEVELI